MSRTDSFPTTPIVGASVRDAAGQNVGTIADVMYEPSGRIRFALVGLRDDTTLTFVPWELMKFQPGEGFVVENASLAALQNAPRLERSDWPCVTDAQWDHNVYAHYGCRPYWETAREEARVTPPLHRPFPFRRLVFAVVAMAIVVGLGYLVSRQGWEVTASQVHEVAATVKDTTTAVTGASADAATTAKAKAALALSKRISALEINVDTTKAVTTLTGTVASADAKALAGQIVADTSGVKGVRNLLAVDPSIRPEQERERLAHRVEDLETQTSLAEAMQDSPELDGAKVRVRVADGTATLDGTVTSNLQRTRAEQLARTFPGVQRVNNSLKERATAAP